MNESTGTVLMWYHGTAGCVEAFIPWLLGDSIKDCVQWDVKLVYLRAGFYNKFAFICSCTSKLDDLKTAQQHLFD